MNRTFNGVSAVLICMVTSGLFGCSADGSESVPGPSNSAENSGVVSGELEARNRLNDRLNADPTDQAAIAELAELDRLTDARAGLVYKLVIDGKHELAFYEPAYGQFHLMETAPLTQELLTSNFDSSKLTVGDIFSVARPGEDVPAVLQALQARVEEFSRTVPVDSSGPRDGSDAKPQLVLDGLRPAHATSSGAHFEVDHHGCPTFGAITWCFFNATSNFTTSATNVASSSQSIANYGTTQFSFTIRVNSAQESRSILAGEVRSFFKSSTRGPAFGSVSGATSSSRWHFGGYFN
jgi:hypothetical protein